MAARLTFLTGSRAGTAVDLPENETTIGRDPGCHITFSPNEVLVSAKHALILLGPDGYSLRDLGSRNGTFVNGEKVEGDFLLSHGALVQFGAGGPGARFVMGSTAEQMPTLDQHELARASEIFAATKSSGGSAGKPASEDVTTTRDLVAVAVKRGKLNRRTVLLVALVAVVGIGAALTLQLRNTADLERALAELSETLETERATRSQLEADIAQFQMQADSLEAFLSEEQMRVANDPRIDADAIRDMSRSVALLVFTYGYAEEDSDRMLRYEVGPGGTFQFDVGPGGRPTPRLSFGGNGDPVQHQGTATAFLVDSSGVLLTNRHVAEPWARDEYLEFLRSRGQDVEGRFIDLRAYFPPGGPSYPLTIERVSDQADVAVARIVGPSPRRSPLPLSVGGSSAGPGDQLVLIAYPTGLHNLLFRESRDQRELIMQSVGRRDVRLLAGELAARRLIQPLIVKGDISDTTPREIIHTAESTGGASGGPLIDLSRMVIGIHYASVRSPSPGDPFQTQRGVPISYAWNILPIGVKRVLEGRN